MKSKILTILMCLVALSIFSSCEDSSEDVFKDIETEVDADFDSKAAGFNDDFDSRQ